MIFKHPKYSVPKFFVKWSCLKAECVEECIGATALDRVGFGTLHQFLSKALSSHRLGHGEHSYVEPGSPNISEQTAQYLTRFVLEKERYRIPFGFSRACNVVIDDNRFHEI